jgi:hypothetical protein
LRCAKHSLYGFAVPFFSQKGTGFLSHLETTRIYNGKTMPFRNLFQKIQVVQTAIQLLPLVAFTVGVDLIANNPKSLNLRFINISLKRTLS